MSNITANKSGKDNRWSWDSYASDSEAARRAGGRAHYNGVRHIQRAMRRMEVLKLWKQDGGLLDYGFQSKAARRLSVNRSTIHRDVKAILAWMNRGEPLW